MRNGLQQPDARAGFVDTNAMRPFRFTLHNDNFQNWHASLAAIVLILVLVGCSTDQSLDPAQDTLMCPNCELVDVIGVEDADTLNTSIGRVHMYGAYVIDHPSDCAEIAKERVNELAGSSVRIESGPENPVRIGRDFYYVYDVDGYSIEQHLVEEGLALIWTQDGQHLGWFVYLDSLAKQNESGCLWHDYQAFQRGEPNEFRIPGLPIPN